MEVVEHVDHPKLFFQHIASSMKDDGLVMISTIRRSLATWFSHILLAEKISGIVPSGTHSYEKFINPEECKAMMKEAGIEQVGMLELALNWKGEFEERE